MAGVGRVSFLQEYSSWDTTLVPGYDPTPLHILAALSGRMGYKKRKRGHMKLGGIVRGGIERNWGKEKDMNLNKHIHAYNCQTINKRWGGSKCSSQQKPWWNLDAPTAFGNLPTKGSKSLSLSSERHRETERHFHGPMLLWKGHTKSQKRSAATALTISPTKVPHSRCFSGHNSYF